ncbi:14190_t:CDS:1, partial [Gigaspora rosea]
YLKESAAEWYEEIKGEVKYWKTKSEDEQKRKQSFYHLLVEQFAPPEKQYRWQIELHMLKQQVYEKIDMYTTKFKRLLSHVNINNFLSDDY